LILIEFPYTFKKDPDPKRERRKPKITLPS
jgi:hypothetical protein